MRPVPVLAYHHVNTHKGDMITVLPEVFEKQMQYLKKAGYKTLKTEELLSYMKGDLLLKEKSVLITFDDGWLDNYIYAYPVFKKYGINATIFITSNWINNSSETGRPINTHIPTHEESSSLIKLNKGYKVLLNWDLIDEMKDSGLVEFHSHTQNHLKCHHLSADDLFKELQGSKKEIEKRLDRPCYCLCWPKGRYNGLTIKTAKDIGYRALFTTDRGIVNEKSDPFAVPRISVKDSVAWFKKTMTISSNSLFSRLYLSMKRK